MKTRNHLLNIVAAVAAVALPAVAHATTTPTNVPNTMYTYAKTSESRQLLERVDDALNAITYTYYLWSGDSFNASTGVYKVDCTGFVNRMVDDANPSAFDELKEARDTSRPVARDYYDFFKGIPYGTTRHKWTRIEKVSYLKPGDVLVWKYYSTAASGSTGHAMIVVDKPVRDYRWSNAYRVRVADSANSGHGTDNRGSSGSGVGAGYILLRYDSSSGRPYAYAWNTNGVWHTDVWFAMARPNY